MKWFRAHLVASVGIANAIVFAALLLSWLFFGGADELEMTRGKFIDLSLAFISLLLTILGIVIAVLALVGYKTLKEAAVQAGKEAGKEAAEAYLNDELDERFSKDAERQKSDLAKEIADIIKQAPGDLDVTVDLENASELGGRKI